MMRAVTRRPTSAWIIFAFLVEAALAAFPALAAETYDRHAIHQSVGDAALRFFDKTLAK